MAQPHSFSDPLVNVHKRTTQVNLWMVVGLVLFFAVAAGVVAWYLQNRPVEAPIPPEQRAAP